MKKYVSKRSVILMLGALSLFLYLINNFSILFIRQIDEKMIDWLLEHTNYFMIYVFEVITVFANWQVIILLSFLLIALVRDKVLAVLTSIITGFGFLINETFKQTYARPRPTVIHLSNASGYSMPSGHSLTAMVFYGLIIIFFASQIKDKKYRILSYVLLSILIALIGLSRIYLRVHYVSDVIAGFSLGIGILTIVYLLKVGIFDNIKTYIEGEEVE
ncbi:MAG: phosphatase PAP2 family protein [Erysipelothrix sp.]|nr:phosphatase PAP2 family protein [Erysipelothrix sp.]